jgi:hypothetical protein
MAGAACRACAARSSDSVLEALAQALMLDDAERAHLFDLARAANPTAPRRRRANPQRVRPIVLDIVEAIAMPAMVRNARGDYLAADAGLTVSVSTAQAGSPSRQALDILASWTATPDAAPRA